MSAARGMMETVNAARDPQAAMLQIIGTNPQIASIWKSYSQHGMDLKTMAMNMARMNGIDPDELVRKLNG